MIAEDDTEEDDPVKLVLVFEQSASLRDQDYGQWRRMLELGVETLEKTLNLRLLAANYWRETGSTQHRVVLDEEEG